MFKILIKNGHTPPPQQENQKKIVTKFHDKMYVGIQYALKTNGILQCHMIVLATNDSSFAVTNKITLCFTSRISHHFATRGKCTLLDFYLLSAFLHDAEWLNFTFVFASTAHLR